MTNMRAHRISDQEKSAVAQMLASDLRDSGTRRQVPPDGMAGELERIRLAYARRTNCSAYSMFEPAQMLAVQERERKLLRLLARFGYSTALENARILDVGCGTGFGIREFLRWGARPENLYGIDLLPERIAQAKHLCPAATTLLCQSATEIGESNGSFDLILQSTVFTSILDAQMKQRIAAEMLRLLSPAGLIVWYDFHVSNPANPDVRGVPRKEVARLFPRCEIHLEKLTLAPPIGRRIARISHSLYAAFSAVGILNTHYLGVIKKA
jgi:SAM-dependent methyltransferase